MSSWRSVNISELGVRRIVDARIDITIALGLRRILAFAFGFLKGGIARIGFDVISSPPLPLTSSSSERGFHCSLKAAAQKHRDRHESTKRKPIR